MAATSAGNGEVGVYYGPNTGGQHALKAIKYWVEPLDPQREDGKRCVAVACFNSPHNLHALTPQQQVETFLVLEEATRDERVRALVWSATGDRAFSAGADLKGKSKCAGVGRPASVGTHP